MENGNHASQAVGNGEAVGPLSQVSESVGRGTLQGFFSLPIVHWITWLLCAEQKRFLAEGWPGGLAIEPASERGVHPKERGDHMGSPYKGVRRGRPVCLPWVRATIP